MRFKQKVLNELDAISFFNLVHNYQEELRAIENKEVRGTQILGTSERKRMCRDGVLVLRIEAKKNYGCTRVFYPSCLARMILKKMISYDDIIDKISF